MLPKLSDFYTLAGGGLFVARHASDLISSALFTDFALLGICLFLVLRRLLLQYCSSSIALGLHFGEFSNFLFYF